MTLVNVAEWLRRDTRITYSTMLCRLFGGAGSNPAVDGACCFVFFPLSFASLLCSFFSAIPCCQGLLTHRGWTLDVEDTATTG